MEESGLDFKKIIQKIVALKNYLVSKWKFLVLTVILGGLLGGTIGMLSTPSYVADSSVLIGSGKGGLGGALRMAQSLGFGVGGGGDGMTFSTENAPDIIKSKRIITNALLAPIEIDGKKDKLVNFYLEWSGIRKNWVEKRRPLANFKFTSKEAFRMTFKEDSIMKGIYGSVVGKKLMVKGDMKTGIVDISVSSENEKFSYFFAKKILTSISHFYLNESIEKEKRSFELMQYKTDSLYTVMSSKERALARMKDQSFRNVMMQGMVTQMQMQRDIEILNVMYSLALKNLEMTKMTMTEKQPVFQIIDEPVLPLMKDKKSTVISAIQFSILFFILGVVFLVLRKEIKRVLA